MEIRYISKKELIKVLMDREPLGLFYRIDRIDGRDGNVHVGIDNSTGDALVGEFKTEEECIAWLNGEEYQDEICKEKIYRGAIRTYGYKQQILMVFEEMAELQKELSKSLRGEDVAGNIAEEIADVEIMLEQMKLLYDIEDLVRSNKIEKIKRLKERLGEYRCNQ